MQIHHVVAKGPHTISYKAYPQQEEEVTNICYIDGWGMHASGTPPKNIDVSGSEQFKLENKLSASVGDWVAAIYEGNWYLGLDIWRSWRFKRQKGKIYEDNLTQIDSSGLVFVMHI